MERKRSISIVIGAIVLLVAIYTLSPTLVNACISEAINLPAKAPKSLTLGND